MVKELSSNLASRVPVITIVVSVVCCLRVLDRISRQDMS